MRGVAFSRMLTFVVLVPLLGLAMFGGRMTYDTWSRYRQLSQASSVLRLAVATGRFTGMAIPGEGALSREVVAGKGDRAKLEAVRRNTDEMYRGIREAAAGLSVKSAGIDAQVAALNERMRLVGEMRKQVDANALKSPNDTTAVIAPAAAIGIDLAASSAAAVNDPALARQVFALYATLQFVENAMVQRGGAEIALREGKLPPAPFALLARGISLNATFGKLFHEYSWPHIIAQYDAFEATNGRDLEELRRLALANTGTPASEAQINRWLELSRDITAALGKVLASTLDTVVANGDRMLSEARFDMLLYLALTVGVLAIVVILSR